jgi:hypothetical protein
MRFVTEKMQEETNTLSDPFVSISNTDYHTITTVFDQSSLFVDFTRFQGRHEVTEREVLMAVFRHPGAVNGRL